MNGGGAKVNISTTNGGVRLSRIGNHDFVVARSDKTRLLVVSNKRHTSSWLSRNRP